MNKEIERENTFYASCIRTHKDFCEVDINTDTCSGIPVQRREITYSFECERCPYLLKNKEKVIGGSLNNSEEKCLNVYIAGIIPDNIISQLKETLSVNHTISYNIRRYVENRELSYEFAMKKIFNDIEWADIIIALDTTSWISGAARAYAHMVAKKIVMTIDGM